MSEDLDLAERFQPLATAPFAPVTDPSALRERVAQRRRTRRTIIAGGAAAAVALLGSLAVLAARAAPERDGPVDDVRTVAPTPAEKPSVPASLGSGPRLVLGAIPPELASEGCGAHVFGEGETASCQLGVPATAVPDGINLLLRPATAETEGAWSRGDVAELARLHGRGSVEFTTIGGRDVLVVGESVIPGRAGGSARTSRHYEVLIGSWVISISAEGITDDQLDEVVGGLGIDPADLGFATSVDALPDGARAVAQGQERLWYQPDPDEPSRSDDNGGQVAGVTYAIGDEGRPLAVHVVRGVDAASYIDTWAVQHAGPDVVVGPVIANGREGQLVRQQRTAEGSTGEQLAVAVDEDTVIIVEGATARHDALLAIAGRTRIADEAPAPGN